MSEETQGMIAAINATINKALESRVFESDEERQEQARRTLKQVVFDVLSRQAESADHLRYDIEISGDGTEFTVVPRNLYTAFVLAMHQAPVTRLPEEGEAFVRGIGRVIYDHVQGARFAPEEPLEFVEIKFHIQGTK